MVDEDVQLRDAVARAERAELDALSLAEALRDLHSLIEEHGDRVILAHGALLMKANEALAVHDALPLANPETRNNSRINRRISLLHILECIIYAQVAHHRGARPVSSYTPDEPFTHYFTWMDGFVAIGTFAVHDRDGRRECRGKLTKAHAFLCASQPSTTILITPLFTEETGSMMAVMSVWYDESLKSVE